MNEYTNELKHIALADDDAPVDTETVKRDAALHEANCAGHRLGQAALEKREAESLARRYERGSSIRNRRLHDYYFHERDKALRRRDAARTRYERCLNEYGKAVRGVVSKAGEEK